MNVKKKLAVVAAGASLLAMAGAANATTYEMNFFGASAQYLFWKNAAAGYLSHLGCTQDLTRTGTSGNFFVTVGTNCSAAPAGSGITSSDEIVIRYSSKASYAGIWALQSHADSTDNPGSGDFPNGVVSPATDPTKSCQDAANGANPASYRWFADANSVVSGVVKKGICRPVTVATSDVEASAFTQSSFGKKIGPMDTGSNITRSFTGANAVSATSPVTLANAQPLAVPFGAFVNPAVAYNKCVAGTNAGQLCYKDSDCPSSTCRATSDGLPMNATCSNANTIDDLTREQMIAIFSGVAKNWADFGRYYASQPIVACFRHAGSGTMATLDYTVMHKSWGAGLAPSQKLPTADYGTSTYNAAIDPATPNLSTANVIWFNDSTGDSLNCIKGASVASAWTGATAHTTSCIGAVGYADADNACPAPPTGIVAVKYNGKFASREAIRNGRYDWFSNQQMYWDPANTAVAALCTDADAFVGNPANLTVANLGGSTCKAAYYASRDEMAFTRASLNSPVLKTGAAIPVLP